MGTITKALSLLNQFSRHSPEIGLIEMTKRCGRDKATVHRYLTELSENGFLEQNQATRLYRLGPAMLRLAAVREATHPVRRILRPIVEETANAIGELAHFSLLQGETLSPIFHHDPRLHGTQVAFDEAEILPLHATSSGLAVLAFSSDDFANEVLAKPLEAFTDRTITDPSKILALLGNIRETGFAVSSLGFDEEVSSVATPIFGDEGFAVGSFAIAIPQARFDDDKETDALRVLANAISKVCRTMGQEVPKYYQT